MARLILLLCLWPIAAFADPASLILVGLQAGGVQVALLSTTTLLGITIGSAIYGRYKMRRQMAKAQAAARDAYNASLEDRTQTILSSNPASRVIYGTATTAGAAVAVFTSGDRDEFKHVVIEWAHHECEEISDILIAGVSVGTLSGSGYATTGKYAKTNTAPTVVSITTNSSGVYNTGDTSAVLLSATTGGGEDQTNDQGGSITAGVYTGPASTTLTLSYTTTSTNTGLLRINHHLGTSTQTVDTYLNSVIPTKWTANHRLRGRCYSVFTFDLNEPEFQSGLPQVTAKIKGKKIYDPRTTLTVWSANAALCIADYISSPLGKNAAYSTINSADLIASANICDETVTPSGGSPYSRYTINGTFTTNEDPLESMAQAMAGTVSCPGGWSIMAGAYSSPILTLTDDDFYGDMNITNGVSRADLFNGVRGSYYPIEAPTVQTEFAAYKNSTYITSDGEELFTDINYPFTNTAVAVEQLNRIAVEDHRQALTIKMSTGLKAWELKVGQRVSVTNTLFGYSAKVFRVMEWSLSVESPVSLVLKEDAVGIWDTANDKDYDQAPNNTLPDPWIVGAITLGTPASGTAHLKKLGDGTIISRIYLPYTASDDVNITQGGRIEIEVNRPDIDTIWRAVPGNDGNTTSTYIDNVQDNRMYNIRARWANTLTYGSWSYKAHLVAGKTEAPPAFDVFTVGSQPDGTRQYNFSYSGTAPADWLGAQIRYVSGTVGSPDWATMTVLQDSTTYYTNSPVELNAPLSGTYTFACKSIDTTLNESTYVVRTVTLPDRRLGNVFDEFFEHSEGWLGTKTGCHVQETYLEANDSTTWATLPSTWAAWTRWNTSPTSPIYYETPARDFGTVIAGQINSTIDADGTVVQELATSADGSTWTGWSTASAVFNTRYLKMRITVTATGPAPVPVVRSFGWQVNAPIRSEYLNDVVISALTGSYRIGTGDIRIPLAGTYSVLKRTSIVVQDNSAGTWTYARIDQSLSPSPRWQFRLNGTLADPAFVDFFIEGY